MNPLQIDIVTLFPMMFDALDYGVIQKAFEKKLFQMRFWNPRDYTHNHHRTVDDRPYGGGPGMVMLVEPLRKAINAARQATDRNAKVIYLSPQGRRLEQQTLFEWVVQKQALVLVAGRYEGIDERVIERDIDEEWSIGDYVLSGGELAAMVVIDAMARLIPGVLGHAESAQQDSFVNHLLDYPHYTRPPVLDGQAVPEVLMSGDHKAINRWRLKQSLGRTWQRRPDLFDRIAPSERAEDLLQEYIDELLMKETTDDE